MSYGLSKEYEYYEFSLDSLDADASFSGSASSTDWPFFNVAAKGALQNIVAIKVLEVQVPYSWYTINSVNNTFIFHEIASAVDTPYTVTLNVGNYSSTAMATELTRAIGVCGATATYTVTFDGTLMKFVFASLSTLKSFYLEFGAGYGIPNVQPNSGNKNPRLWIGFGPGKSATSSGSPQTLTSPNVVLTSGPSYLYLNSTRLGSDVDIYLPTGAVNLGGGKAGHQIAKIPVNVNAGGIIFWQDPDPQKWFKYNQLQALTSFDFYLSLGNTTSQLPLQLNGLSFSLKLGILKHNLIDSETVMPTSSNGRISRRDGPKRIRNY